MASDHGVLNDLSGLIEFFISSGAGGFEDLSYNASGVVSRSSDSVAGQLNYPLKCFDHYSIRRPTERINPTLSSQVVSLTRFFE